MNRHLFKRLLLTSLFVAAATLVALAAAAAAVYWRGIKNDAAVEQVGVELKPSSARLGQTVRFCVRLKTPWHRKPIEATVVPGAGAQPVEAPLFSRERFGFGYVVWRISADFKPFRTGTIPAGEMTVKLSRHRSLPPLPDMSFQIPAMEVEPLPLVNAREPLLAPPMAEPPGILHGNNRRYLILATVLLLILLAALYLTTSRRRNVGQVVITPWGAALLELAELRDELGSGKVGLELCFAKLTDIAREYIEKRFLIHAPQQTTYEFLAELNQIDSPLPEQHRPFLREFMTVADLVKFAKLPPDRQLLTTALDKAENLISETRPDVPAETQPGGIK